jgi:exopolysaccharide production protein ExoZ
MIRQIQYLRGIAAMMVVWHHAQTTVDGTTQFLGFHEWGKRGVDLFFVISGFIMLVTTWEKPISPAQFIRNRIQRIVPLYWAVTFAAIAQAYIAPWLKWDGESLAKSLLFIPYYSLNFPGEIWPLLVPGWTLNYEMFFYALFALLLLAGRNWRVPVMALVLGCLVVTGMIAKPHSAPLAVYTSPLLLEFCAGMILGRFWVMRPHARQEGGHSVLMALGDASYSIYLTHLLTLGVLRAIWRHFIPVNTTLAESVCFVGIALFSSAVAGYLCYRVIEKPVTDALKEWHPWVRAKETQPGGAISR